MNKGEKDYATSFCFSLTTNAVKLQVTYKGLIKHSYMYLGSSFSTVAGQTGKKWHTEWFMLPVCNHNQVNMVNVTWLNLLFGAGTSSFVFYISVFFSFSFLSALFVTRKLSS